MRPDWARGVVLAAAAFLISTGREGRASAPAAAEGVRVVSVLPANGAKDVCIDTPLRLAFSGPPGLSGSGGIQLVDDAGAVVDAIDASAPTRRKTIGGLPNFNYYPILIDGNEATVAFNNSVLAYGKTYHVKITGNPFIDGQGRAIDLSGLGDWHFATKATGPKLPADGPLRITVSAEGKGDFATVQGALDFIPEKNAIPTTVFVRNGIYHEIDYVAGKNDVTILGEDREKTVLAYPDNQNLNNTDRSAVPGGYRRGMFRAVGCKGLVMANLTLHNTTPQGGSQAEAIIVNGGADAHAILTHVDVKSFQDTLQINGQAYVSDCRIEGDVDFMWGTGPVFFENCTCTALRKNAFYTQIRNTAANHGYVYDHCVFDGAPGVTGNFLSRIDPGRFPASEVVLLKCTLTSAVGDVAWRFDNFRGGETPGVHFWEFGSVDAAGKAIDDAKRFAASRRLTKEADAETVAHYSDARWVLGGNWTPAIPVIATQPPAR